MDRNIDNTQGRTNQTGGLDRDSLDQLQNATVFSNDGDKIGSVGQVYLDDQTNQPTFVTVKTGLLGTKENFVPLNEARTTADGVTVPFDKNFVKDAPNVDADGNLSPEEEQRIYEYYSMDYGHAGDRDGLRDGDRDGLRDGDRRHDAGVGAAAGAAGAAGGLRDRDGDRDGLRDGDRDGLRDGDRDGLRDGDRDGLRDDDDSVVVRDEKLNVGTERRATGRARLRKHSYITTETVEVPVEREELVVERESIDPNSPEARADGRDDEASVTLHEDVAVADKSVDAEKVSLGKRTTQDTERVSEEVRHEDVEMDRDGARRDDIDGTRR